MRAWLRKWWPAFKALFAVAILVAIGRQFWRDLENPVLWQQSLRPQWLVLSGVLYILGLGFSAVYWYRLLLALGQQPRFPTAVRAHFIGQMGKYLPGKAWALVLRSSLVRGPEVRMGVALLTSFYDVLATMAGGALLAAVLFALYAPDTSLEVDWHSLRQLLTLRPPAELLIDRKVMVILALLLLLPIGIPILPPIFNRIVHRMALPFRDADAEPVPRIPARYMFLGLLFGFGCWLMMGASLWSVIQGVMAEPPPLSLDACARYTASMSLAYVAGFIILLVPSGLGVREFFLTILLVPELHYRWHAGSEADARSAAVLAVVVLRLVWTAMELVVVGMLYMVPTEAKDEG